MIEDLPADIGSPVLVMKSTVPVGTGEKVRAELDAGASNGVGYASCPEFLAEGTAVRDFMESDRVVVGSFDQQDGDAVAALHDGLDAEVVRIDIPSAEMVKLAANAYLATRISFINEIANVCELVGADVEDVARGMGLDRRIGTHYLRAGLGYGGSCFPKDISFLKLLAGNSGYHFQLVTAVIEVNELQMRRPVAKLQKHLGSLRGKRIALLGLAFKAEHRRHARGAEHRPRRAAAGRGRRGRRLGPGRRRSEPPARGRPSSTRLPTALARRRRRGRRHRVAGAARPALGGAARSRCAHPLVVDGRNHLDAAAMRAAGYVYEGMGRAASPFATLPETPEPTPTLSRD